MEVEGDVNISKPLPKGASGDGFQVLKEGFLLKTKRLKTITSVKQRWFVLKRNRDTGECILEYYDGKVLRGSVNLKNSQTIPRPGSAHFEIRTPGRTYYLAAEHANVYQAISWVQVLQRLTPGRKPRPQREKHDVDHTPTNARDCGDGDGDGARGRQVVYYQMGDELIPLSMNPKTNRVRQTAKRRIASLKTVFESPASTTTTSSSSSSSSSSTVRGGGMRRSHRKSSRLVPIREAPAPPVLAGTEEEAEGEEGHGDATRGGDGDGDGSRGHDDTGDDDDGEATTAAANDDDDVDVTGDGGGGGAVDREQLLRRLQRSVLRHSWPIIEDIDDDDAQHAYAHAGGAVQLSPAADAHGGAHGSSDDGGVGSVAAGGGVGSDDGAVHDRYQQQYQHQQQQQRKRVCLFRLTDLEWKEQLGEGFFGRAVHKRTGQAVVVKELKESDNTARAAFVAEMSLLKSLHHHNVLHFMGIFCKDDKLHLLTEFVGGGSLDRIIQNKTGSHTDFPWRRRLEIALDIAAGMTYLHSVKVIHRDLKSENCLIRHDGSAVVADFGLARVMEGEVLSSAHTPTHTSGLRRRTMAMATPLDAGAMRPRSMTVVGTPYFMAPELLLGMDYNESVDVFSFGILLCELIGRIEADPDIMPRTNAFGVDEAAFRRKWGDECPPRLLTIAFTCAHTKAKLEEQPSS
ncbi:TKL/LISK/LIMK protein kinase [Salpingoeca rosetta]|uniref:TKL/LISK/LIMK protein kinase n=1 Tax=Salpingoeca rosetta (strain ATCC 50818 / BSB-021) TaxID=946362 RepID=F2U5L0_SALR5|nr:TKL/LISK/LIMK protein kinase [Salpingoeca rosetta]EGD83226.1 TKL/LISK/LIMK protein kinase [Salpingoeca rosetta]|eukprot:XP_004995590.1 TKL/LISK/LIMK protein kinase [Salpingoeca rosetta]